MVSSDTLQLATWAGLGIAVLYVVNKFANTMGVNLPKEVGTAAGEAAGGAVIGAGTTVYNFFGGAADALGVDEAGEAFGKAMNEFFNPPEVWDPTIPLPPGTTDKQLADVSAIVAANPSGTVPFQENVGDLAKDLNQGKQELIMPEIRIDMPTSNEIILATPIQLASPAPVQSSYWTTASAEFGGFALTESGRQVIGGLPSGVKSVVQGALSSFINPSTTTLIARPSLSPTSTNIQVSPLDQGIPSLALPASLGTWGFGGVA